MADEPSKASEEKGKPLVSLSANVSDVFGHGQGASKLFETIGARLGQVFSGVGEFMNVFVLDKRRIENEAYRTRELGSAQADAIQAQWQAISPIINSGQQVRDIGIVEGKVGAQLQGVSSELLALHQRSNNRMALENAMEQHNLEASISYAAAELDGEQKVASEPVEPDWTNRWSKFARDASSEEMQLLWGKVLAGEVKQPGSFSPRTLQTLSLLTQKEAQLFQRVCAYAWRDESGYYTLIMVPPENGDNTIPTGFSYPDLQLLQSAGLIEVEYVGSFSIAVSSIELCYNGSKIEVVKSPNNSRERIKTGQASFTRMGDEVFSICNPEYDQCIMDETIQYWILRGYQVSSPFYTQPPKPPDIIQ